MMFGASGLPQLMDGSLTYIKLPDPQSLIFIEAIRRPAATVFELECLCFGLPKGFVLEAFNRWLGIWGKSYLLPVSIPATPSARSGGYFIASLGILHTDYLSQEEELNLLYSLA